MASRRLASASERPALGSREPPTADAVARRPGPFPTSLPHGCPTGVFGRFEDHERARRKRLEARELQADGPTRRRTAGIRQIEVIFKSLEGGMTTNLVAIRHAPGSYS